MNINKLNNLGYADWWYKPYKPELPNWWVQPQPYRWEDFIITTTTGDTKMFQKDWSYEVTDTTYTYTVDLPGHTDITVANTGDSTLMVTGKRNKTNNTRNFHLPDDADFANGTATFKDGVLTITVPRVKPMPKTITVKLG